MNCACHSLSDADMPAITPLYANAKAQWHEASLFVGDTAHLLQVGRGEFKGLRITTRPPILSEQPLALLEA